METRVGFVAVDYVVFAISVAISIGIGIFQAMAGGKQKTTSEYLVGNRQMSIIPVTLSLIVSFESSIMMLAYPAEVYTYGIMFVMSSLGFLLAVLLGTRIVVPLIHPLKITSVYEYLELRYKSKAVRILGTLLGMLSNVVYMAFVLYGPGLAIEAVTDFPLWASVLCISTASVLYTAIGGLKAVIWTDVFQCFIMFTGVFAVLIKGTYDAGGPREVVDISSRTGRMNFFDFDLDPTVRHTFWGLVIGSAIRLINMTFSQPTVQRICALEKQKDANKMLFVSGPAFLFTLSLACAEGLVAYAYFTTQGCDPIASGDIKKADQIMPYMVFHIFRNTPGMAGLFMAAVFSASLSTLSSLLNSSAAMAEEDIIRQIFRNISDHKATIIAKISVVFFGALGVGLTYFLKNVKGIISQISTSFTSAISGPITGLFLFSAFYPWGTKRSAIIGTLMSVALVFWLTLGQAMSKSLRRAVPLVSGPTDHCYHNSSSMISVNGFTNYTVGYSYYTTEDPLPDESIEPEGLDKYYSISYLWINVLGQAFTIFFGIIVSLIEGVPSSDSVDVRFVLPFFDQFFPCIPKRIRKRLYFGVPFDKREIMLEKYGKDETDVATLNNLGKKNESTKIELLSFQKEGKFLTDEEKTII
ncbi:solute carrier family 5 (sodium-dependent multivitamin transporter), member 6 [Mytilus galloprovincialis]|uniref:Solute carrier family 5 (Sodium-dependent multivitamin transporter), member 6 n=1 Tax=Mytilus galloprovincialis TaxID=29158 RepID=A0A8B6DKY4_MYTGA|nr:solute carrier family 5 (sodium-dependent multivitamin transporter), member 6 [Mytilus galloprovincialis]